MTPGGPSPSMTPGGPSMSMTTSAKVLHPHAKALYPPMPTSLAKAVLHVGAAKGGSWSVCGTTLREGHDTPPIGVALAAAEWDLCVQNANVLDTAASFFV